MTLTRRLHRLATRQNDLLLVVLVLSIAIFFRFYQLAYIPPGILGDEAVTAWLATRILRGEGHSVFFAEAWGRMPMQVYLEAALFRAAGVSLHTARSTSALAGIVTVTMLYVFVRTMFGSNGGRATPLPLLSSLLLAVSYWHVVYSRFAADPVLLPVFVTSVSLLVWRAIDSQRVIWSVMAGLLLGMSVYSYPPAAFLPLLVLAFLVYRALRDRAHWRVYFAKTIVVFSIAFVVTIPLGHYALNHPDTFFARTRDVSVFNPDLNQGSPLRALLVSGIQTAAMFSFRGEPDWARNPAGRPVLDPIASAIFLVGVAAAMLRVRQPRYFFVVLWLVVMSLPGVITAKEIPNWNRTIGVAPAVCILVAVGIETLWERFKAWRVSLREQRLFWLCVAIFFLWTGASTFGYFFTTWRAPEDLEPVFVETSEVMNQLVMPDAIWILPINSGGDPWASDPTIEYLYTASVPHWYLSVDEATAARDLTTICHGRSRALLINCKYGVPVPDRAGPVAFADPKELLPFLLTKYGRTLEELEFDNGRVLVYELPAGVFFSIADDFQPMNVQFGEELTLLAAAIGGSSQNATSTPEEVNGAQLPSGKSGWAVFRWEAVSPPGRDYKVGVYLVDQRGRRVAQADKVLLGNYGQSTTRWTSSQEEMDYYTLPTLAGTPPGWYDIQVAVYNEQTMDRLPVLNEMGSAVGQTATVGRLQVVTPLQPAVVQPAQTIADAEASVAPDIRLLGYDITTKTLHPGDTLSVALYWKALRSVHGDYVMTMQLNDQHGRVWAGERGGPVYGTYPTTEWAPGEVLRDWHDLSLDPQTPSGGYELMLRVTERGEVSSEISLGAVQVSGRARQFRIPEMQHALGVSLGEQATLLGYNLSADRIQAGQTLTLTLYWQALTEMDTSYTVFTHLLDQEGRVWSQKDNVPGGGQLPTTSWVEGEIIEDRYEIEVRREAPAGEYVLEIGMYQWETGDRLEVLGEHGISQADAIVLATIQIFEGN